MKIVGTKYLSSLLQNVNYGRGAHENNYIPFVNKFGQKTNLYCPNPGPNEQAELNLPFLEIQEKVILIKNTSIRIGH